MKCLLFMFISISCAISQDFFHLQVKSTIKNSHVFVDGFEYATPINLYLETGLHKVGIRSANLNEELEIDLQQEIVITFNQEKAAYIYFLPGKSKFDFNEDEITSYRLSRENLSTDLDFQKILNYEVKLSNLGSVTFILEHQNYEKLITHLDIKPYYTYYITPVFCETDVYRNQLLEIVTENRKRFLNKVNLALSGLLGYFIYQSINHHSKSLDAYEIYQHSYERNKLNGFYNTYETEFNKRNSNIYLAIGTGVALTYLLFFEKWTDLSEYRRDGSSVSLQNSFSQKSLQIKFSYNF